MTDFARYPNYQDYLQLGTLLSCQRPPDFASPDPDATRPLIHHEEQLFIIMHQTMELWFKMVLADLEAARDLIGRPQAGTAVVPEEDIPRACTMLGRTTEILRLLAQQFTIIETMTPLNFLTFRDELTPASGFESWQFRELEILAGLPDAERVEYQGVPYAARVDPKRRAALDRRLTQMTFREALFAWLARTPYDEAFPGFVDEFLAAYGRYIDGQRRLQAVNPNLSAEQSAAIGRRLEEAKNEARQFFTTGDPVVQRAHAAFVFLASYRDEPLLRWPYALLERALEFEEHFRLFRFRHARMVERMIGLRVGSGGSAGVAYLDETARRYRIFGDLLRATSYLIKRSDLADLPNPGLLRFNFQRSERAGENTAR
jgi:tryptophan 2,3-dioxygenase